MFFSEIIANQSAPLNRMADVPSFQIFKQINFKYKSPRLVQHSLNN